MSRPSATQSPLAQQLALLLTSASRTAGLVATLDAASETSGARIASVTSSPLAITRSPSWMSSSCGVLGGRAAVPMRHEPDRPVHRARVQVGEAERARGSARDRALARPRGPIDGHDHGAEGYAARRRPRLETDGFVLIAQIAST